MVKGTVEMKQFGNIPEGYLTGKDVAFEESQKVADT